MHVQPSFQTWWHACKKRYIVAVKVSTNSLLNRKAAVRYAFKKRKLAGLSHVNFKWVTTFAQHFADAEYIIVMAYDSLNLRLAVLVVLGCGDIRRHTASWQNILCMAAHTWSLELWNEPAKMWNRSCPIKHLWTSLSNHKSKTALATMSHWALSGPVRFSEQPDVGASTDKISCTEQIYPFFFVCHFFLWLGP